MASRAGEWTVAKGALPIFLSIMWPFTCLVVVSFPNYINRWMGVSMVLAAGLAAWRTATDLSPDGTLNEMYVRYILIGGSHALAMAYKNPLNEEVPNAVSVCSRCATNASSRRTKLTKRIART
jgi:hypothetical protein